jgi:hypothetical protein
MFGFLRKRNDLRIFWKDLAKEGFEELIEDKEKEAERIAWYKTINSLEGEDLILLFNLCDYEHLPLSDKKLEIHLLSRVSNFAQLGR